MDAIELCDFTPAHLAGAVALSRAEGWPHRAEDWDLVLSLGRGVAATRGGCVLGTALMVPFGEDAAAIAMVIVDSAMRGRGLGRRLMAAVLEAAGDRECRLVATAEGLPLYEKLGFQARGAVCQHQGILAAPPGAPSGAVAFDPVPDIARLAAIDREATSVDRTALLARLASAGRIAVAKGGGFAALRPFGRGAMAGPVVARSGEEARDLLSLLFAQCPGRFMRVDVPEEAGLGPWLEERGLAPVGGGIAMRRAERPANGAGGFKLFALASQALG
ncbi:GNAT family N-acetyltransferase [Aureimonas populi]|uniref:GNAT family N-acetyltransferase n=1 Tax=Aureimonas populi TaxID=1701758 RepID=A0ABW5CMW9_9HYPH|nr:GNAT family N-acetyltransferase [Aureimonas populi]